MQFTSNANYTAILTCGLSETAEKLLGILKRLKQISQVKKAMYAWSFEVDLLHLKYVVKNWWFVNFIPATWPSLWRHLLPSFQIWYSWYKFQLQAYLEVEKPGSIQSPVRLLFHKTRIWSRPRIASWDIIGRKVKVFIALETFWYISKCKKGIWRLWFKKKLKNGKISHEFN